MNINVLQNWKITEGYPYPHVHIENALPEAIYKELDETFPEQLVTSVEPNDNGRTYRYKANPALVTNDLPAIWQDFFAYHTSEEYFRQCIQIFEPAILHYYDAETYEDLLSNPISIRKISKHGKFVTDCQFVVHEPLDDTHTTRTPHLDNPGEIYAGLLYMKKEYDVSKGGNFTIHETNKKITKVFNKSGRTVEEGISTPYKSIPYMPNNFVMFLNVCNSVHSVTPRINAVETRRSINIIGEYNKTGKMWEVEEIKD